MIQPAYYFRTLYRPSIFGLMLAVPLCGMAQVSDPTIDHYADKILNRAVNDSLVIDRNGDGVVDVRDLVLYINGRAVDAWFPMADSSVLSYGNTPSVEVRFSNAVTGAFSYEIGGTAVSGSDFQPLSGQLNLANAASALIPVPMIKTSSLRGPRAVTLTLKHPVGGINASPGGGGNGRYSAHTMKINDADLGVFVGNLGFQGQTARTGTNGQNTVSITPAAPLPASAFRMAVRSQGSVAVIEIPDCNIFPAQMSIPVALVSGQPGFSGASIIQGSTVLSALGGRTLSWSLELANVSFANQGTSFTADCRITLKGLSASGSQKTLTGSISATRIDN